VTTVLALVILFGLKQVERYIHPDYYKTLCIVATQQPELLEKSRAICQRHNVAIKNYDKLENVARSLTTIVLNVQFKWNEEIGEKLVEEFTHIEGVRNVCWK
jgi:uncharacterized membrane protein YhiD involved in acid resistance